MKTLCLIFMVCFSMIVKAQPGSNELQLIQGMYGKEKHDLIKGSMELNSAEAAKFWPVYDEYETERQRLGAERINILAEYINDYPGLSKENYPGMVDKKVDNLSERVFKNDMAFNKLHKTYYKKMKKAVSPLKAAQFIQLETYLQNSLSTSVASQLPFIGGLKHHQ